MKIYLLCGLIVSMSIASSFGSDLEKAELYRAHGLITDAKRMYIEIITSDSPDTDKAQALYSLGAIAFEENYVDVALESWQRLVADYPNEPSAMLVKDRIDDLAEIVGEVRKATIENAVAQSYLKHGDFWSRGKSERFIIDTSWIPKVEAAVKWYDKVITEFPSTEAAKLAYEEKMKALLGWKDRGQYGEWHGIHKDFKRYMPQLVNTFEELESAFPNASNFQAYRFQVAQAYWREDKWDEARSWLNKIIVSAGDGDSFYKDLSQRRLNKLEH